MISAGSDNWRDLCIKKMIAFIERETEIQCQAIKTKASQIADNNKMTYITTESQKCKRECEAAKQLIAQEAQVFKSSTYNKSKLECYKERANILRVLFERAGEKLAAATKQKNYPEILKELSMQCIKKLILSSSIEDISKRSAKPSMASLGKKYCAIIRLTKADSEAHGKALAARLTEDVIDMAVKDHNLDKAEAKKYIKVALSSKYLLDDSIGGVVVLCRDQLVSLDNTFKKRMISGFNIGMPEIRAILFPKHIELSLEEVESLVQPQVGVDVSDDEVEDEAMKKNVDN